MSHFRTNFLAAWGRAITRIKAGSPVATRLSDRGRWIHTAESRKLRFEIVPLLLFGLLLFFSSGPNAQTRAGAKDSASSISSALRPLDALGMSFENFTSYLGPRQKEWKQQMKEARKGYRVTFELPPYAYTFESGKVVEVTITANSFQGFINEGTAKWGPPTRLEYLLSTSPYGANERTGTALWDLPGGIVVDVRQTTIPGKVVGVTTLYIDRKPVYYTQTDAPTDAAIVRITRPPAPPKESVQLTHVL